MARHPWGCCRCDACSIVLTANRRRLSPSRANPSHRMTAGAMILAIPTITGWFVSRILLTAKSCGGERGYTTLWACWDGTISRWRRGRGSAIFLHVARPDFAPTEGCIAAARTDLRALLAAGVTELWVE